MTGSSRRGIRSGVSRPGAARRSTADRPGDLGPPIDQSVDGVWKFGTNPTLDLVDPSGYTIEVDLPGDWPGPTGEIQLARPIRKGLQGRRVVRGLSWQDDLGGMGAGYAAALNGTLYSVLGPESDPTSQVIARRLAEFGVDHHPIRVPDSPADWTLLITSGEFGDKLPIGFRGCHARLDAGIARCTGRPAVRSARRGLAAEPSGGALLRAPGAQMRFFAPAMRNMLDRDCPISSFAAAIDVLSCNRREWETLEDREEVAWLVSILVVTDGPTGSTVRFTTPGGRSGASCGPGVSPRPPAARHQPSRRGVRGHVRRYIARPGLEAQPWRRRGARDPRGRKTRFGRSGPGAGPRRIRLSQPPRSRCGARRWANCLISVGRTMICALENQDQSGAAIRGDNSATAIFAEQVLARLENAVLAGLRRTGGRGLRLGLQVVEVGLAERALDHLEVELQVGGQLGIQGIEQEAAELLAAGAGQPGAVPDGAQGVELAVGPVLADVLEPGAELGRVAQGLLHPRGFLGGQGIGQVVAEHGVVDRGRTASSGSCPSGRAVARRDRASGSCPCR